MWCLKYQAMFILICQKNYRNNKSFLKSVAPAPEFRKGFSNCFMRHFPSTARQIGSVASMRNAELIYFPCTHFCPLAGNPTVSSTWSISPSWPWLIFFFIVPSSKAKARGHVQYGHRRLVRTEELSDHEEGDGDVAEALAYIWPKAALVLLF